MSATDTAAVAAVAAVAAAGRGIPMKHLSRRWYYRRPEPGFWQELGEEPLMYLHVLLDGVENYVVDMLEYGFDSREKAREALANSLSDRCIRAQCVYLMAESNNAIMLENYTALRRLVVRMDAMEIERLLGRAA
ncbi:MAG: hypothetical protein LBK99_23910 [Opitutaceae bacterium]|nr:hypothetical protein [Opitutaceae bacterium]